MQHKKEAGAVWFGATLRHATLWPAIIHFRSVWFRRRVWQPPHRHSQFSPHYVAMSLAAIVVAPRQGRCKSWPTTKQPRRSPVASNHIDSYAQSALSASYTAMHNYLEICTVAKNGPVRLNLSAGLSSRIYSIFLSQQNSFSRLS